MGGVITADHAAHQPPTSQRTPTPGHQPDAERIRGVPLNIEVREVGKVFDGHGPSRCP